MIRTSYDPESDAFMLRFAAAGAPIDHTDEVAPGVMLDFDARGQVIGVEVLNVRQRTALPGTESKKKPAAAE